MLLYPILLWIGLGKKLDINQCTMGKRMVERATNTTGGPVGSHLQTAYGPAHPIPLAYCFLQLMRGPLSQKPNLYHDQAAEPVEQTAEVRLSRVDFMGISVVVERDECFPGF